MLPIGTATALRTLSFNPATPGELWLVDGARSSLVRIRFSEATLAGSSTIVADEEVALIKDRFSYHYMPNVSSIAFDPLGQFATCQESMNQYRGKMQPNFFMGPSMYDTRPRGWVNNKMEPCEEGDSCFLIHVDMLHESPLCMGLVHDHGAKWVAANGDEYRNVYWALGGGHSQLVRFDFEQDHGPGSMDHAVAGVRRYTGLKLTRLPGVSSQMAIDHESRHLYVADTGADRVVRVVLDSGYFSHDARVTTSDYAAYSVYSSNSPIFNYSVYDGLLFSTFTAVPRPSGIALTPTTVYVSSHSTGEIYAFNLTTGELLQTVVAAPPNAILGLTLETARSGPEGTLYFVTASGLHRVRRMVPLVRDAPSTACGSEVARPTSTCTDTLRNGEETDVDCGGRLCPRCGDGRACLVDGDCSSSNCTAGVCGAKEIYQHTPGLLFEYLNSPFYLNSFLHHNVHQNGMGASYLNLYPIMQQEFCDTVGNPNATEGRPPDCNSIDHDALLLGNCYCHYCLLQVEQPCLNNGVCNNYQMQGYNCSCPPGYHGDHCQFEVGVAKPPINFSSAFPWYVYKASPPPPPTPPPLLPPPTAASDDDSGRLALIIGLAVGGGLLLVVALAIGVYLLRSSAPPTRASNVTMDPKANNAAVSATSAASTPAATAAAETIEHGDAKGDAKGDVKGEAKGDAKGDAKRIAGTEGIHRL